MTTTAAAQVTIKHFLEAGVHFGHQTRRWNPKMKKFIFGERDDIYIIDLKKTMKCFRDACDFAKSVGISGGEVLFIGTKKQAQDTIKQEALRAGMPYVNHRWLGGMLTNFFTIRKSIDRLHLLEKMEQDGSLEHRSKKEISALMKEKDKLEKNLGGVKNMKNLPSALFVVDPNTEEIAVREANRLKIPVIAITDTNCDPDPIQWIIPANDDAIRSVLLLTTKIADSVIEGRQELEKDITSIIKDETLLEKEDKPEYAMGGDDAIESKTVIQIDDIDDIDLKDLKMFEENELEEDKILDTDDPYEEVEDKFDR